MSSAPRYALDTDTALITARGKDPNVWRQSLDAYAQNDPLYGTAVIDEDFFEGRGNVTDASHELRWFIQDANAGGTVESFVSTDSPDGIATLSATTDTDHFGIEAHYGLLATSQGVVTLPTATTDARGRVVFQARVDLTDVDQFFIGLTEPFVAFLSAFSALPTTIDYIGFYQLDDGVIQFVCANDNDGGTAVLDSVNLGVAADNPAGFTNFAFAVNVDSTVDIGLGGKLYFNEARTINPLALPIEALTAKFAITRGVTGGLATLSLPIDSCVVFIERE